MKALLGQIDAAMQAKMERQYRLSGRAMCPAVSLPADFVPPQTSLNFVRNGDRCEIYFDAPVRYTGSLPEWQDVLKQAVSTNGFRLVAVIPGGVSEALVALEAALQVSATTAPNEQTSQSKQPKLRDLVAVQRGKTLQLSGRRELIRTIQTSLLRATKPGLLLLGHPGVGKTALVEMLAWEVANGGTTPSRLKDVPIHSLDLGSLLEDCQAAGDLERQVRHIIELSGHPILFLDEIHQLSRPELAPLRDLLKPSLADGTLRVIGASTPKEWRRVEDDAFKRRFSTVWVPEPNLKEATAMLEGWLPMLSGHHSLPIRSVVVKEAVVLADRYLPSQHFPDKGMDVLDLAAALQTTSQEEAGTVESLVPQSLYDSVSRLSGLPAEFVDPKNNEPLLQSVSNKLSTQILGQGPALDMVVGLLGSRLAVRKMGWRKTVADLLSTDDRRPLATMLLCGPTGVGKTATARVLADALFGGNLITLNGSDVGPEAPHGTAMWTGSPPGYVGSQNGGVLSDGLRATPAAVILVDEIEKASSGALQNILIPLLGEGVVTDRNTGDSLLATQCVVLCTSNLAIGQHTPNGPLLESGTSTGESELREELKQYLRAEVVGRFHLVANYVALPVWTQLQLLENLVAATADRLGDQLSFSFSQEALQRISERFAQNYSGARGVQEFFTSQVVPLLASWQPGGDCIIGWEEDRFALAPEDAGAGLDPANCHNGESRAFFN